MAQQPCFALALHGKIGRWGVPSSELPAGEAHSRDTAAVLQLAAEQFHAALIAPNEAAALEFVKALMRVCHRAALLRFADGDGHVSA